MAATPPSPQHLRTCTAMPAFATGHPPCRVHACSRSLMMPYCRRGQKLPGQPRRQQRRPDKHDCVSHQECAGTINGQSHPCVPDVGWEPTASSRGLQHKRCLAMCHRGRRQSPIPAELAGPALSRSPARCLLQPKHHVNQIVCFPPVLCSSCIRKTENDANALPGVSCICDVQQVASADDALPGPILQQPEI